MAIPHVTHNQETLFLYADPSSYPPLFEMDPEEARELLAMLVGSIAYIEGGTDRLALLFDALLERYRTPRR